MMLFLLSWLALVLIRPQDYPALVDLSIPILPITLLGALGTWVLGRERKPLNQPTYLLFAVFIVIGMLTMAVNGWIGGALVRLLELLPMLVGLPLSQERAPGDVGHLPVRDGVDHPWHRAGGAGPGLDGHANGGGRPHPVRRHLQRSQ